MKAEVEETMKRVGDQVPTQPTTILEIMSTPEFARGVSDARAKRPFPVDFDTWRKAAWWPYERGRMWATCVPRSVNLKRNGQITAEAIKWFRHFSDDIL